MPDYDTPPVEKIAIGFQSLIEGLRDDVREDIRDLRIEVGESEKRVSARVESVAEDQRGTRRFIEEFASSHSEEHEAEAIDRRVTHTAFYEFIRHFELDKARRDGALGIARYSVELVSQHAPRLIALIAAMAAALGIATGNLHISLS